MIELINRFKFVFAGIGVLKGYWNKNLLEIKGAIINIVNGANHNFEKEKVKREVLFEETLFWFES